MRFDPLRQNEQAFNFIARALDAVAVAIAGWFAFFFYFKSSDLGAPYENALVLGSVLTLVIFPSFDNYRSWRGRAWYDHLKAVLLSVASVMAVMIVISAVLHNTQFYSRAWFAIWAALSVIVIFVYKQILFLSLRTLRDRGWNRKRLVIFGAGSLGRMVVDHLLHSPWSEYEIFGMLDDDAHKSGETYRDLPIRSADGLQIDRYLQDNDIQEIWLALPLRAEDRMREVLGQLRHSTAFIRFVPNIFQLKLLFGQNLPSVAGVPVLDINTSPMSGANVVLKRIEDFVLALVIIVLVSPIMLLIAIAIRIDSRGPAIFKQERHGWDGKVIKVYKFRSMHMHREADGRMTQATKGDARLTRIGHFLRRTSLDELPQFFNVLQGRMSVVGPRPHAVIMNEFYKDKVEFYFQRHKVKPGITGLAQVSGYRGETDTLEKMERRIELDLDYIQRWSVWLDLKIVFLTVFKVLLDKNAY
jgi:putative colanic acid biosynthesis UDP-glucose lipid carrier transferase